MLIKKISNYLLTFAEPTEIALYLYNAITNGKMVSSHPSKITGGLDRVYEYDGYYYTFVGMGDNGFIVTAFPTRK